MKIKQRSAKITKILEVEDEKIIEDKINYYRQNEKLMKNLIL